jgi:predicted MFS family arabinose efflux permease
MTSPQSAPAWYVVLVTTAAQMVVAMANIVLPTLAPKVAETLQVDPVLVGYHVGLTFGAATLTSVYGGLAVMRWGAASATQFAMLSAVAGLGLLAVPHLAFIVLGSLAIGIGMGLAAPSAAHLLVRHTPGTRRNLVFSIKQTGVPLGGVIVALTAPALAVTVGWRWALVMIAAIGVATLLLARRARSAWDADRGAGSSLHSNPFGGVPLVWKLESLRWISLAAVLYSAVQRMLLSFTVIYLVAEAGYGLVEAGVMLSLVQIGGAVSRIPWGWLADRLRSGVAVLTVIGLIMTVSSIALVTLDASWPRPVVYLLFLSLGASCVGWNGIVHAECARLSPPGMISLVAGGTSFFIYGGVMIGPPLFTLAYGAIGNYSTTFGLMIVAAVAALGLLYLARRPKGGDR